MDRDELAATLAAALAGKRLSNIGDQTPGWRPEPGHCHENARRWVEANPTYVVVHGRLNARGETFENRLRFHSHSIVRSADGELLDITLSKGAPQYTFIPHPFDDDPFRREIIGRIPTVDHLLGPDPVIPSD
ncbi:hypothetical protein [Brevundimonas sp.]|jgi:hypothetical protein|uniref:hypothetical protein n=1 Tax=Brevundimonas sp. TaxID=1871086 RepID=UPI0037C05BCB